MTKIKLGKLIRKLRQEKGLSLRKLADMVDMSYVNISHIENGKFKTDDNLIKQLAKALDHDEDQMLSLVDSVNDDIKQIIKKLPNTVPEFLRTAKNLTNEEWKELIQQIKTKDIKNDK